MYDTWKKKSFIMYVDLCVHVQNEKEKKHLFLSIKIIFI
jgi:hypothetical protein